LNPHIDFNLVHDCIQGKRTAQYQLYNAYSKGMYNVCYRLVGNRDDAEDALQMSFVEIFNKLGSYNYEASLGAWIKKIVVNKCIDQLRRRKIELRDIEDVNEAQIIDLQEPKVEYDLTSVRNAINNLPHGYKVIFNLYTVEGYDHQEISEILNISVSTSKSQYHRAKTKVYDDLKKSGSINKIFDN
jgi:RNA polymerase sigma factor (sigma-70 family)